MEKIFKCFDFNHQSQHLSWDEYFMAIANISALRSKDPNRKVGCCLVDEDSKRILAIGYNGFPRGCPDSKLPWTKHGKWLDTKYPYVCHAEANAILNSNSSLNNSTAYVTLYPCNECAKLLIQAGIKKVVFQNDTTSDSNTAAKRMFNMTNVKTKQLHLKRSFQLHDHE